MSDDIKTQIVNERWRLDKERRSASTSALEAIAEQQRPAREALHAKCEEATGHNMTIEGNTVGGLSFGRCVWCGKGWLEREVEL